MLTGDFVDEFGRWRGAAEKAMGQVSDDAFNKAYSRDGNSIAMIARHVAGNLKSRFTDFLTTDGEKPWRDRDSEFLDGSYARADVMAHWNEGFDTLARELSALNDDDLARTIKIRGTDMRVHEALCRSLAHIASHLGQIILLAKIGAGDNWKTLTIPKGKSAEYNANPKMEKAAVAAEAYKK